MNVIHNRVGQYLWRVDYDRWCDIGFVVGSVRYADIGAYMETHDPSSYAEILTYVGVAA